MVPPFESPKPAPMRGARGRQRSSLGKALPAIAMLIGLALIAVGLLVPALNKDKKRRDLEEDLAAGEVRGNTYYSKAFRFRLTFPEGWYVLNEKEMREVAVESDRLLSREGLPTSGDSAPGEQTRPYLLYVRKYPYPGWEGASLVLSALRAGKGLSSYKNGGDLLRALLENEDITGISKVGEVRRGPYKYPLGGKPFYRMDVRFSLQGQKFDVSWFLLFEKGRILIPQITWIREEDREVLENAISSIRFD